MPESRGRGPGRRRRCHAPLHRDGLLLRGGSKGFGGARGPIVATATATKAAFLVTVLSGIATADHADRTSMVQATSAAPGRHSPPTDCRTCSSVPTMAVAPICSWARRRLRGHADRHLHWHGTGFGSAIANAGDIDGDGLPISHNGAKRWDRQGSISSSRKSPPASWGSTTSWPATLTDTQGQLRDFDGCDADRDELPQPRSAGQLRRGGGGRTC